VRVAVRLRQAFTLLVLGLACLLAGCATMDRMGANIGMRFAENHILPPVLTDDDLQMGCIDGEVFSPIVLSMGPVGLGAENDQIATLLYSTAALCAEQAALDSELTYLRATRESRIEEAEDARIVQKRWLAMAAQRQYHAYQHFEHYYTGTSGDVIGGKCPPFRNDLDELVFMLGAISGLQAIVNDVNSQNAVNVPKDIAAKTERAMTCLDNAKWWGLPKAVRAAVWNLMPGGGPEEPWGVIQKSMDIGKQKGVRIAYAIYAISAYAKGDDARLQDAFKQYQATVDDPNYTPSVQYRIFDRVGDMIIWGISDRYQSEHVGTRTPAGALVPAEAPDVSKLKLDDLL